jgi:hypothetical protein
VKNKIREKSRYKKQKNSSTTRKIHPLPYQKKNHENPESFVWLSIHNCKRIPFEAGKIV